ncbi:hypothetical protein [Allochromatium vinosum]|uniref:Uncharacterized protein n=1 Tax=Allochromatium vinosum (strain ATCC 17899 / DSM 180 / NBRC 103801 / NCIMB 10441 / D) TaxID=572477 RepID=D3RN95_ALLVD|nr:hypothetical protein [Allochromatium vinosum]ADC61379.1 hypothetical protein Alvin_0420 [Allochromatium vinosum DSM 180]
MSHDSTRLLGALALGLLLLTSGAGAQTADSTEAGANADLWSQTRERAAGWWEQSRDLAGQTMRDARGLFDGQEPDFNQIWQRALPTLDQALLLEQRHQTLPESAWFGHDQKANQAEIDALLDEAVSILSVSPALKYRDRIQAQQEQIVRWRAEIADHRQKRVTAPSESTFKKTIADYDALIAAREADIRRAAQEVEALKREFAQSLRAIGLKLEDEQLDLLLSTVVGDNLVDLGILFDNVKSITLQLEELLEQSGEDLQSARRYYGLYVVLLKSLDRMHVQIDEAIDERYLPQIDDIVGQTQTLAADTERLLRETPDRRTLLEGNLQAQQLTLQAAGFYRQYLVDQAAQVRQAREELEKDIAAAWNTYETVRVSGELVGLVRSSQLLLEGLMNRQAPALRPFESLEMQREIQKLTRQLRGEVSG